MQRLTTWNEEHTNASVETHSDYINKLARYEDLDEKFIESTGRTIEEYFEHITKLSESLMNR